MSRGPENTFIASVHRHLPATLYAMKNHNEYNGGIADCWYSGKKDLWIEYKFIEVPKRDDTVIDMLTGKNPAISYLQQEWLKGRHKEGRQVGVIIGCKDGGVWFKGTSWNKLYTAGEFRTQVVPRQELAALIDRLTQGK